MNHADRALSMRGFTIPEILVAMALLAITMMSLYAGLMTSYRASHNASLEVAADIEAVKRLESVMAGTFSSIGGYCCTDSAGRVFTMTVSTPANVANNARLVTLDVAWSFLDYPKRKRFVMVKSAGANQSLPGNSYGGL